MKKIVLLLPFLFAAFGSVSCSRKTDSPQIQLKYALTAAQRADWSGALKFAHAAFEKLPGDTNAAVMYAIALENSDRVEDALQCMQRIAGSTDHFFAQYTLGRMLFRAGKYEQCLKPLANAARLKPEDANTLVLLARASAKLRTHQTKEYYQRLLLHPRFQSNASVWNELGVFHVCQHQARKALPFFLKAQNLAPGNPDIQLNLAIVYDYQLGLSKKAAEYYKNYLRLAAGAPEREKERVEVSSRLMALR